MLHKPLTFLPLVLTLVASPAAAVPGAAHDSNGRGDTLRICRESSHRFVEPSTALPAEELVFEPIAPFVSMAAAFGDRFSGGHGTFGIFPGNAQSPPHTHSFGYHGVVISGVIQNPFGIESQPSALSAGSHWYVPAGEQHVTACISAEPCVFYFHADEAFDFAVVPELTDPPSADAEAEPFDSFVFEPVAPFVSMAAAFGDRFSGAHGTLGVFPGGASSPYHTHSESYRGVVISGTMINPFGCDSESEGEVVELGAGSAWEVPAGSPHRTACVSDEPCVFYFHSTAAFDFGLLDLPGPRSSAP